MINDNLVLFYVISYKLTSRVIKTDKPSGRGRGLKTSREDLRDNEILSPHTKKNPYVVRG